MEIIDRAGEGEHMVRRAPQGESGLMVTAVGGPVPSATDWQAIVCGAPFEFGLRAIARSPFAEVLPFSFASSFAR